MRELLCEQTNRLVYRQVLPCLVVVSRNLYRL